MRVVDVLVEKMAELAPHSASSPWEALGKRGTVIAVHRVFNRVTRIGLINTNPTPSWWDTATRR